MKAVIQVVNGATLKVDGEIISQIDKGLVVYFCVEKDDKEELLDYFTKKISNMRIFVDSNDKMNLSVKDIGGEILLVSQFTLAGDCEHGNRPSFIQAAKPEKANELYEYFCQECEQKYDIHVEKGIFGADMQVSLLNDGPVTILIEK